MFNLFRYLQFRTLFVSTLFAPSAAVVALTGYLVLWPMWLEFRVERVIFSAERAHEFGLPGGDSFFQVYYEPDSGQFTSLNINGDA